ncbi:MAG: oligosaccharide flippase family protein [Burkholderiaceae bacterium]
MTVISLFQRSKALFQDLCSHLIKNQFVRSVMLLAGGTAFTQAIMVLILPVLTRLYTPQDFSVLTVYFSVLSIFAAIACLRYEIAIPLPESDEDSANVLGLSLALSLLVSVMAAIVIVIFPSEITLLAGQPELRSYLWAIPLGIWLTSTYAAFKYWATRKKRFASIASVQMSQSISSAGTQLGLGVLNIAPLGLLLGGIVNSGVGCLALGFHAWREGGDALRSVCLRGMLIMARKYDSFPKFSVLDALANNAGIALPVLIIASVAIGPEAGYLALATQVLGAPLSLVGSAVGQVYFSHAAEKQRSGDIGSFTLSTMQGLARLGIGPMLFAGIVSPIAFPLVFGEAWGRAGELVAWLAPWYATRFICSPIASSLNVTNNLPLGMKLQILGLITRVGAVALAGIWLRSLIVEVYAVTSFAFDLLYLFMVSRSVGISIREVVGIFFINYRALLGWLAFSLIVKWVMEYYI